MEIGDQEAKAICLPPRNQVVSPSTIAVARPNVTIASTLGGSVAIGTGFLLAVFPQLYDIPGQPLSQYIRDNRGIQTKPGIFLPWAPSDDLRPTADHINCIVKCALGFMYHMIRKPQQNPNTQIGRRFSALYSTVKPGVQPPPVDIDPLFDLKETALWLLAKGLDIIIPSTLLEMEDHTPLWPTAKAFISQLKLVSSYAEMTPYLTIKSFISDGLSKASMLPGVGAEIQAFLKAEDELKEQHGDKMFPYLKCLRLPGHERLAPVNFRNLCKVANARKRWIDGTFGDYKSTEESLSSLTDKEVEDAVAQPPMKKRMMSQADAEGLKEVFRVSDEDINEATSSAQCSVPVGLEAALLALTETLKSPSGATQV
ncbi:Nucleoprotein [Myotis brandtii]|uniref:Nucleoprotein n=1 Tax=Myotis brandtii TaxID=109478 RepID=S7PTE0_MYOBR|nr:Nucleoprotein [Myotis brandtii]